MLDIENKDELHERLENLSNKIKQAKAKFEHRGHRADGVHMSNLINVEEHHKILHSKLDQADESLWQNMKQTWHEEMQAMLDSFAKIIEYEDEEFRKNKD